MEEEKTKTAMLSSSVEVLLELNSEDFLVTVGAVAFIEVCGQEWHPGIWWVLPKPHMMPWAWFANWSMEQADDYLRAQVTVVGFTLEMYWCR